MSLIKEQIFKFVKAQGKKAGVVPVKTPENEETRLKELHRLNIIDKDLSKDRRYNNITQLAAYLTNCPQSSINLLDDKYQVSKNGYGFNLVQSTLFTQAPREITLCQYVLDQPHEQLIINDIHQDERTKNMKNMVIAPNLRFYAGSPLITSKGFTIGTLCVMGKDPSNLDHFQAEGLRLLADQVINFFEIDAIGNQDSQEVKRANENLKTEAKYYSSATVLFTDFVGFTKLTETLEPGELLETIDEFFNGFDKICSNHNLIKVKTIGDSYMAVSGIPEGLPEHPNDACKAGIDIIEFVKGMNMQRKVLGKKTWDIRIGIHTGPVIAGISSGSFDIWGDTVNIAARMESSSETSKVHISEATFKFVEHSGKFQDRGKIDLKNKGSLQSYFIEGID